MESWIPQLTSSIAQNFGTDESLALLCLYTAEQLQSKTSIPEEISIPIMELLLPLASANPDENIRFISFRLIASFLSLSPVGLVLMTLQDLLTDSTFPQMRAASISLLKERVLDALGKDKFSPFASKQLLEKFGLILFRPNPPDLFERITGRFDETEEWLLSSEVKRLTECLSFYYVLLLRDQQNKVCTRTSFVNTRC
jgi:hypothetical protein